MYTFGDDVSEFDVLFTVSGKKYMFGDDVSEFDDLFTVSGNKK